jgi:hypothetical protein
MNWFAEFKHWLPDNTLRVGVLDRKVDPTLASRLVKLERWKRDITAECTARQYEQDGLQQPSIEEAGTEPDDRTSNAGRVLIIGYDMLRNLVTDQKWDTERQRAQRKRARELLLNPGPDLVGTTNSHALSTLC